MDLSTIAESLENIVADIEASKDKNIQNLIPMLDEIAFMFHSNGEYAEAEKYYLKALNAREAIHGFSSPECIGTFHNLGLVNRVRDNFDQAEFFYLRAMELTRIHKTESPLEFATRCNYLSGLHMAWEKFDKAKAYIDTSLEIYREQLGEDHLYVGYCLIALSLTEFKQGNNENAGFYLDVADGIINPAIMLEVSLSKASLPALIASLALIYARQNKHQEAEILFRYALIQEAKDIWPTHPSVGSELGKLSQLYKAKGRAKASDFLEEESQKLVNKDNLAEDPEFQKILAKIVCESEDFVLKSMKKNAVMDSLQEALKGV